MSQLLQPGDTAPWFRLPVLDGNPDFRFDTVAGRPVVLLFCGSAAWQPSRDAMQVVARHRDLLDDRTACFFGVSVDPDDVTQGRIETQVPGIRWFLDHQGAISRAYGAVREEDGQKRYDPHWLLLDSRLRVIARAAIGAGEALFADLRALLARPEQAPAPVLVVPRVFEPELCRELIRRYDANGGEVSGFMREVNGRTVPRHDLNFKRRFDHHIEEGPFQEHLRALIGRRLVSPLQRAFQFHATRIERWLVACYDGDNGGGYFQAHRDNTTKGTAHRRFACTINLNAEAYEGGDLVFPEFGPQTYRAPTGGAVLFSCSLMHEARPVTRGRRYAFLPFLYDDAAAQIREQNQSFLDLGDKAAAPAAMAAAG